MFEVVPAPDTLQGAERLDRERTPEPIVRYSLADNMILRLASDLEVVSRLCDRLSPVQRAVLLEAAAHLVDAIGKKS
jgi:hypothetical protein